MRMGAKLLLTILAVAYATPAWAADKPMGIVTGPKTGTYFAIARDLARESAKSGIELAVKPSEGSIDNIKRINSTENAMLGVVQSDVLGFLTRSKSSQSLRMAESLRVIFPLYNEEVHVLTRRGLKTFADLQGKKVAIGEDGSGNMITAVNLFTMMDIKPAETKKIASAQGVLAVLRGELDAVIFVGGKPVRLFKNLEDLAMPENQRYSSMLDQVHFLPLNDPKMLAEYKPAALTRTDYAFIEEDVPTIAVQALMVTYDFSDHGGKNSRCQKLSALAKSVRDGLAELQKSGHPKWKEVNLDADLGAWKKDSCSWK